MAKRGGRSCGGAAGLAVVGAVAAVIAGCAALGLGTVIQPPQFTQAVGREAELRVLGPAVGRPLGGARVRIWARVQNPNAFGFTLATLRGNVHLEGQRAAEVDLPLGLPLRASGDTIVPLDFDISFADLPGLADAAQRILTQNRVAYRLDGSIAVDAGAFGQPSFGPTTWLQGETRVVR